MLVVKLLGQFEVQLDDRRITIPTRNAQALFAYLLLNAGISYRREKLAGLLWPDSSEESARSNLRHELWRLRKAIEPKRESYFLIDDISIAFNPQSNYSLDVLRLENTPLDGSSSDVLMAALSAYHGELLPGFYEEWAFVERNRVLALFESRIARLLEILQAEERWSEVLDWGMRWIAAEQWSEPAYRAVISAYANRGDLAKAAATYEQFSLGLQKELGIKPSEQTRALFSRIKSGWNLGGQKEISSQTTQKPKSPLDNSQTSLSLPKVQRSNLPRPLTSFIGREKELQRIEHQIARSRLVTITGAGGVGKTRLAIQAASALTPLFQDGVWWVELAHIYRTVASHKRDQPIEQAPAKKGSSLGPTTEHPVIEQSEMVALAILKALRIPESPGLPPLEAALERLRDKELLLVLDNCEHLIETCAFLAERILAECINIVILATSREALGVPGEIAWLLPSLSLPTRDHSQNYSNLIHSEAVRLFIERAAENFPNFQPEPQDSGAIAQVCLRLDGIPLAIELAAARTNLLSVQEISARLDNSFRLLTAGYRTALPRHQTLQAAIEWSFDLLNQPEQVLFRRLSVFTGSFALEAAESICGDREVLRDDVLTLLGRLVDKSLLQVEPTLPGTDLATRYRFLDTICSFARMKLDEAEETSWLLNRHANYYVRLAEAAEPELLSQKTVYWHNLLKAENDNLRSVIEWSTENNLVENALRVVGALLWFWFRSGSSREGRDLALKALASPASQNYKHARARVLNTAGFLLCIHGDTTAARRLLDEALIILRTLDDETSLAWTLQIMGLAFTNERNYELADEAFREGLAITQKSGNPHADSFLFFYGDVDLQKGEWSRAKQRYEDSVNIFRASSNKSFLAYPLRRLGYLALEQNELLSARQYFLESLAYNQETGDIPGVTASLISLAALAIRLEKTLEATYLSSCAERQLESLSLNLLYLDQSELGKIQSQLRNRLDEETFTAAFTAGWEMSEGQINEQIDKVFGGM